MTQACNSALNRFCGIFARLWKSESGATAIEYGLIATLIAVACIGAFQMLGNSSTGSWAKMATKVSANLK